MQQSFKLVSPESGMMVDEADLIQPIRLRHILPNTLFTINFTEFSSFIMRADRSILDTQTYQEWDSLDAFCIETGYGLETTIDAWQGEVINPDWEAQQQASS